jgi:hypothetical protein
MDVLKQSQVIEQSAISFRKTERSNGFWSPADPYGENLETNSPDIL